MRRQITRAQAALLLGVTPQTVTNYVKKGLLTGLPRKYGERQTIRLYEDEVRERAASLASITLSEKEFDEYRKRAESLAAEAKASYQRGLRDLVGARMAPFTVRHMVNVLAVVVDKMAACGGGLTEKDKEVLSWLLSTGDADKTAALTKFTREGVRLRAVKAIRKLAEAEDAAKTISALERRCKELERENAALRAAAEGGEAVPDSVILHRRDAGTNEALRRKITEFPLSLRTFNCCRRNGIVTVADLVRRSRREVAAFRNLGNKSIAELDNILDGLGLWYKAPAS